MQSLSCLRAIFEPHQVRLDRVPGEIDTAKNGLARVFDADPEAKTYFYHRGDERTPDKEHPVAPGVPAQLGGPKFVAEKIELPRTASCPDKLPFVIDDLLAAAKREAEAAATKAAAAREKAEQARAAVAAANSSRSVESIMHTPSQCPGISRRTFLADTGMGFTGLALSAMLFQDGVGRRVNAAESGLGTPHFEPKAKSVIWIFLCGGVSHMESFDIKPELNKYAGKSIDETPYKDILDDQKVLKNLVGINPSHGNRKQILPLSTGYKKYGECGLEVGDWFTHIGECADDLAVVRSLWTIHNDHGTQLTWHTGRHPREGSWPTIGSWVSYGLGSMNQNLPQYVVLGTPTGDCCGGEWTHGAGYLGPEHAGVRLAVGGSEPLPFVTPAGGSVLPEEQAAEFSLLGKLNRLAGIEYPDDPALRARIKSYELAFGMQTAVPETLALERETAETQKLYGIDDKATQPFGQLCLAARRLVERGVRFVQIFHGGGGGGAWDAHSDIKNNHTNLARQVDKPIAGLLRDLKRRGLLNETLVVWGTEFGRSPGAQGTGRDHHPNGFCAWLAGGGIQGGVTHGATDELGFHAVESPHYVTDIHATALHLLGLDPLRLEVPGRKRIDLDRGKPIREILA